MRIGVLALLIFSFLFGQSQNEDSLVIRNLADEVLLNGKAYKNLHHLTKKIGARLAGSANMPKAEQWAYKLMQESGAQRTYLQACKVPRWIRGGKDIAEAIIAGKASARKLDVVALGNSIGTGGRDLRADILLINSFEELDQRKDEVKGKIVFYNYKFNPTYVNTFNSYRDAGKYRGQGPSRAAQYGAVGVIVRSMSHSTDNNPHTGATRYDTLYKKIPAVAVGLRDADWLDSVLKKSKVTARIRTNGHFLPDVTGHNVIGELTGSEFPNEIITIGGHLDSWDNGEGAHDDGAGCVQTIEVLRAFRAIGFRPKRTIRFVLFANEENGLRGGYKYASEAKAKNEKHIFAIESDAGGFTPRALGFTVSDQQFDKISAWKELIAPYGCNEFLRGGGGADIGPLRDSVGAATGSLNPDSQRYFDVHHARNDVFEAVNKRELELGAINMAAIIYLIDKYGL